MIASALSGGAPPEDWDIDWKYTDGPLENFGWSTRGSGYTDMQSDGLHINSGSSFIQLICPVQFATKSVMECDFVPQKYDDIGVQRGHGLRLILANPQSAGSQLWVNVGGVYALNRNLRVSPPIPLGKESTARLELAKDGSKYYLDGKLLYDTKELSDYYVSANKIFQQDHNSETVLKALRYKFIER